MMEHLIGKFAYKKRGFYSGLVGKIEKSDSPITPYKLVYKTWGGCGFRNENDIVLVEGVEEK